MGKDLISIMLLNWNGKDVTADCLESIKKQTFKNYEVILIDNASTDGSSKYLKKKYPFVRLVQNKKNLGYAGGHNSGIKSAKGNYLLIINNDIVLDKNFLKEIWKNKDKADILGVKNYFYDHKDIFWAIGSSLNEVLMVARLKGNKEKDIGQYDKADVDQAVGSAMLVNKKVIDKVNLFDESLFAYYEETEWQTRAQRAGFTISWVPTAKLWHKVAYSYGGEKSPTAAYYLVRNRAYYIKKWGKHKLIAYSYWTIEVLARIIYGLLKNRRYARLSLRGALDFFNGVKGKIDGTDCL
jgi:GT2 family glycosyltransferase